MPTRKAIWKTDGQFDYGSPTKTNVEIIGSGDSAYIALAQSSPETNNVPFTTPGNYTYDPVKIEIIAGIAKLKASAAGDKNWPFTTPANYTYDSAKIEVTGGVARLKGVALSPYAWWHLNESSGTNAPDSSGNGRNGTLINMEDADWVAGKLNNCLNFDGVNEYVNCGNIASFERTDPFSVECWFKTSSGLTQFIVTRQEGSGVYRGWGLYVATNGKLRFMLCNNYGTDNYVSIENVAICNDGNWHHVVATYDGSSAASGVKIYVDGSSNVTIVKDSLNATIVNAVNCQISARGGANIPFDGHIDEVVIYDSEITQSDVTARYNGGAGTESMPGAYDTGNPPIYPDTGDAFGSAIDTFTETATKPSGSEIKYHVSSDDGVTWKYWTGAAWAVTDDTYTQANLASEIHANIGSLASSGTFKFRALLHSDAGTVRPELDNIYIAEGTSYPIGDWPISMNNDITPTLVASWLSTAETVTKPANTDIKYQYSIDGGSSYNGSWLTEPQLEAAIQGIAPAKDGTDKIRFKFQLSTTDNTVTPEIDNLEVVHEQGYPLTGTYKSTAYAPSPTSYNGLYAEDITFDITLPSGTTLTITARTINHILEANYDTPWTAYNSGDTIGECGTIIQFMAELTTTDIAVTPRLNWLEIDFHIMVGIMQTMDTNVQEVLDMSENKLVINEPTSELWLYNDAGDTVIKKWPLTDRNGAAIVLSGTQPSNRDTRSL